MKRFNAEFWRQSQALFDDCCLLSPEEREAFLSSLGTTHPDLRKAVEDLLDADSGSTDFLENPVFSLASLESTDLSGSDLDGYHLEKLVGRGGVGTVYRAQRIGQDFEQTVAVKFLDAVHSPHAHQGFLRERRILARLNHPVTTRLIDGSTTAEGVPYVVMEWVDGIPITNWSREKNLDPKAIVRLLCRVGEGVHYAHQQLIVHRDLKPSNILVSEESGPKLLDFGIAKLFKASTEPVGTETTEPRWLTPGYASPEQVLGQPITTASDIYSLGLIFYELLTGIAPQPKKHRQLVAWMDRREQHLPLSEVTTLKGLSGSHQRDLQAIIEKTLKVNPEERYGSVEALLTDLEHFLEGRPVSARQGGALYQLSKNAQRNLVAWITVALLAGGLVLTTVAAVIQARDLAREVVVADRNRDSAEFVNDLLGQTLELLDPAEGREQDSKTKAILDQTLRATQAGLTDEPLLRTELITRLGSLYRRLGFFDDSEATLRAAVKEWETRTSPSARSGLAFALVELGRLQSDLGHFGEAESNLLRSLQMNEDYDLRSPLAMEAHWALAEAERIQSNYLGARTHLERALGLAEKANIRPKTRAMMAVDLGEILVLLGQDDSGLKLIEANLLILERELGRDHPAVGHALHRLGTAALNSGHYQSAREPLERALMIRQRFYGENHPHSASSLANLAAVVSSLGSMEDSILLYEQVLALDIATLGPDHLYVATDHCNQSRNFWYLGGFEKAVEHARQCVYIYRKVAEPNFLNLAVSLDLLGLILADAGEFAEAHRLHEEALSIRQRRPPEERWHWGDTYLNLAELFLREQDLNTALEYCEKTETAFDQGLPKGEEWQRSRLDSVRGAVLAKTRTDPEQTQELLERGHQGLLDSLGEHHRFTQEAMLWKKELEASGR